MAQTIRAKFTQAKPAHAAVVPMTKPLKLDGIDYYGWEMFYLKDVKTGKTDKHGQPIINQVRDWSQPVSYDPITTQINSNKVLSSLVTSNVQVKSAVASIITRLVNLELKQGGTK